MIKHSGVRTISNIRVVVVAFVAGQAQRLQALLKWQLLSPPNGMQPWLMMRRSSHWDAAGFADGFFKGDPSEGLAVCGLLF